MNIDLLLCFSFLVFTVLGEETILRPNLYFGTRSPTDDSHLSGVMWFEGSRLDSVRHECKHEDGIKRWGWTEFDPRGYGKQKLVDVYNFVKLDMNYMKDGHNWVLQIDGNPIKKKKVHNVTVVFYYGVNGMIRTPSISKRESKTGIPLPESIPFFSKDIGYGHIHIKENDNNSSPINLNTPFSTLQFKSQSEENILHNSFWFGKQVNIKEDGWKFASLIKNELSKGINSLQANWQQLISTYGSSHRNAGLPEVTRRQLNRPYQPLLPNSIAKGSNIIAVQLVYQLPFSIKIFITEDPSDTKDPSTWNSIKTSIFSKSPSPSLSMYERMSEEEWNVYMEQRSNSFSTHFLSVYDISKFSEKYQIAAKAAISNLLGGISFFSGSTIQRDENGEYHMTPEGTLITAIPGRSFFPRGFVWDEGFHQLLIIEWNQTLSETILSSWLDRIESTGYLEREQILGDEARSRVPEQFVPQDRRIVNPPTFVIAFEKLANRILSNEIEIEVGVEGESFAQQSDDLQFLEKSIPKLWKWIQFIAKSQKSHLKNGYKWFGRNEHHCLSSGFDDTPRHTIISEMESNVDLVAWLTYSYKILSKMEYRLHGETPFFKEVDGLYRELHNELLTKYWDETKNCFGDLGLVGKDEIGFETHLSYISILPFSLMLLDEEDPRISKILDIIENPEMLWSDYGIRSLAKNDEFFGTEENYWRGKIWINMNYLLLKSLYTKYNKVGYEKERCQALYSRLRTNLINNIVKEYYASGFFWENYDSSTGKGTGVHPFTGWTTLFVLIMTEKYE